MALDKQKILNELGSVVNQLQSADCGCMGKLFSNSGQTNANAIPLQNEYNGGSQSCGHHGHCHHGYNAPCAGEPYSGARHCMGFCNPPKLYADTYNYLNKNMMQPVVQEVYEDLKSINPTNTVMNNPMASQMGLSQSSTPNQGNAAPQNAMRGLPAGSHNHHQHIPHLHFGNAQMNSGYSDVYNQNSQESTGQMGQGMGQMSQEMGQTGHGMGQIGHGMGHMGYGMGHTGQGMAQMGQGMGQTKQTMEQYPDGMSHMGQGVNQIGEGMRQPNGMMAGMGPQIVNMMSSSMTKSDMPNQGNPTHAGNNEVNSAEMSQAMPNVTGNSNQFNSASMHNNAAYMGMNNMRTDNNSAPTAFMSQPQAPNNLHQNVMPQQSGNANPQQMNSSNPYGQHYAGMSKFNEMFPGVMKKDLGFDPMAIAIQMNPSNQQRSAMDTMQKMMMGNLSGIGKIMDSPAMQPVVDTTNAVTASLGQPNQQLSGQHTDQQNIQQQRVNANPMQNNQMPQQVYTATTAPTMNQQQIPNQQHLQQSPDHTKQLAGSLPTVYEDSEFASSEQPPKRLADHNAPMPTPTQHVYREPILPADTSRNLLQSHHFSKAPPSYDYNTLGQPVQMVPPQNYHTVEPVLPQTLYGQVVSPNTEAMKFSNVKATVSKTSLVGNRPIGKTPSRSQLRHIYNQYKGSQSFTQQNIRPSGYTGSTSEGRINVPHGNTPPPQYIERVGGDSMANDIIQPVASKLEPNVEQIGDVPMHKKQADDSPMIHARNGKTRNGLQDQVFTSSPTSAKWSFHGTGAVPYSVGYRFRAK